jgi:hypothetical protein
MLKKIILFCLILLILPNTFAEITIEVLPAPVISAELVEGGDLSPNTTYYFAAFAGIKSSGAYGGNSISPASNMVTITTTETHKSIKIIWGILESPTTHTFIRWDTDSLQDENGEYIPQESRKFTALGWSGNSGTEVTLTSLSEQSVSYALLTHPELSILPEYLDSRINRKKGICKLTITGTETYENLINTIRNSDHNDMFIINNNSFTTLCSIYGTGSLTFENKNIKFLYTKNLNPNINFNNSLIFSENKSQSGGNYGNFYNCSIRINNNYQYSFKNDYSNIKISGDRELLLHNGINSDLDLSYDLIKYYSTEKIRELTNMTYRNKSVYLYRFSSIKDTNTDIYNNYFENCGTRDLLLYASSSGYLSEGVTDDSNYNIYNSYSNRESKLPLVSYVDQSSWTGVSRVKAKLFYTQYFNITDKFGNPIDQAKIIIKDSNNTTISEIYTDINGSVDYNLMTHLIEYDETNANGLRSKYHYQGPFTITVSKYGYYSYRSKQEIISEKNQKISLQS